MTDEVLHPDDSENVLTFTGRFDTNADIRDRLNLVEADKPEGVPLYCNHGNVLVDEHSRGLTCRRCGAVVDPFDWILTRTKFESQVDWQLKELRQEIKDHREGLEKLKREETNCRARIKTAQFRLNDVNMALLAAGEKLVKVKGEK
ncbi:MAG: hypothetical protein QM578_12575 [Pantoea sp.]|uniref:hypothetical protein n=1 Tax=Pantoea sp. TaxID=69393 RepID=UPI0039E46519